MHAEALVRDAVGTAEHDDGARPHVLLLADHLLHTVAAVRVERLCGVFEQAVEL